MILTRILNFLAEREFASLSEVALAVGSTPDAVRSMLQTLERKGRVHRLQPLDGCGTRCRNCTQAAIEVYGLGPHPPEQGVRAALCEGRGA